MPSSRVQGLVQQCPFTDHSCGGVLGKQLRVKPLCASPQQTAGPVSRARLQTKTVIQSHNPINRPLLFKLDCLASSMAAVNAPLRSVEKSPLEDAGLFSQAVFAWMTPHIKKGFEANIQEQDVSAKCWESLSRVLGLVGSFMSVLLTRLHMKRSLCYKCFVTHFNSPAAVRYTEM